ncbi:transcriptional repressor [bacterium]|nr:transcriptional repressor [bacterium]
MARGEESVQLKALLDSKGLKFTHERQQLLEEILKTKHHFDADSLYEILKAKGVRISRDTVYRTLPLLLECGVLQKSVGDGRREYFERVGTKGHHDHMVCIQCSRIIEFKSDEIEKIQDAVCESHGFRLIFHDHRLFGYCQSCTKG